MFVNIITVFVIVTVVVNECKILLRMDVCINVHMYVSERPEVHDLRYHSRDSSDVVVCSHQICTVSNCLCRCWEFRIVGKTLRGRGDAIGLE
jgi:hypothetical protein